MDNLVNNNPIFNNIYKDKKVLITGNTGFKGSWLSLWLKRLGAIVYGFSKDIPTNPSLYEELGLNNLIQFYRGDVRNLNFLSEIIADIKPNFVFHLAAQAIVSKSFLDPIETMTSNTIGTLNLLEALRVSNHECVAVIITSDKCYDNVEWVWGYKETDNLGGKDIYSGSKGAAEILFKSYYHSFFKSKGSNVLLATARAGNVIGGGDWAVDRIIPDCVRSWSNNNTVIIRNPLSTRPWQHVLEPLSGYLHLGAVLKLEKNANGESFNFGPGSETTRTVMDLIVELCNFWKFDRTIIPYKVVESSSFHEAGLLKLNCDKALTVLKWTATLDFEKLIEFTSKWYIEFYKKRQNMYSFTMDQIIEYENIARKRGLIWTN